MSELKFQASEFTSGDNGRDYQTFICEVKAHTVFRGRLPDHVEQLMVLLRDVRSWAGQEEQFNPRQPYPKRTWMLWANATRVQQTWSEIDSRTGQWDFDAPSSSLKTPDMAEYSFFYMLRFRDNRLGVQFRLKYPELF